MDDVIRQPSMLSDVQARMDNAHVEAMGHVMYEIRQMFEQKGGDYNQLTTFIENMPFGDFSWGTLCWIKAHRAASVTRLMAERQGPKYDALDDVILDLAVYAVSWLAFRRVRREVEDEDAS